MTTIKRMSGTKLFGKRKKSFVLKHKRFNNVEPPNCKHWKMEMVRMVIPHE